MPDFFPFRLCLFEAYDAISSDGIRPGLCLSPITLPEK